MFYFCYIFYNSGQDCAKSKGLFHPKIKKDYRKCRLDSKQYIASCPDHLKAHGNAKLCETKPASFVYEDSYYNKVINNTLYQNKLEISAQLATLDDKTEKTLNITVFSANRKFRNSYCASCYNVALQGCHLKRTFNLSNANKTKLFNQYINGERKYMFIFRIDFNERTCTRDSDAYLVYPNYETGQDTCQNMAALLRHCDCNEVMDLSTMTCKSMFSTKVTDLACRTNPYRTSAHLITPSEAAGCQKGFTYEVLLPRDAQLKCDRCKQLQPASIHNISACKSVYTYDIYLTNRSEVVPSVHCYTSELLRCAALSESERMNSIIFQTVAGRLKALPRQQLKFKDIMPNVFEIKYTPLTYLLNIKPSNSHIGFDTLFSTIMHSTLSYCSKFKTVNTTSKFKFCNDGGIQVDRTDGVLKYADYYLKGKVVKVCAEYELPGFYLQLQDYILSALSITVSIIYIIYYLVRRRWTLTGNLIVSAIATLVGALLFYSLIKEVRNSKVACRVVGSLAQYFLMCTHTWTNSLAIWMIRGITKVQIAATSGKKTYIKFALYSWLTPGVFIALTYVLDRFPVAGLYPVFSPYLCFVEGGWIRV
ncbi:hypothetical protein EB796_001004 [Bugula neritina]|uniref:G-protein coupled receptors family 2 profile 2 domain-containing protein n=1 Tax=Bugula neritina TaxID=10212 RepID=A0A7J7KRF2_BUGNE|nr:hypothetical protein EB796_001004 [Bugula neritina]